MREPAIQREANVQVEPYTFQEAEQLRLGRFPVLDTILYRWARYIEETLFEHFQIEVYAGASIVEEMRFATFFASLKSPKPIYFFDLEPLTGQGLLVLDNRFANLCVARPEGGRPVPAGDQVMLAPHNQPRLQEVVQHLMRDFEQCWSDVHPVQAHLRRITTYLFRARVLSSYERCMVAQIHLSGEQVSGRLTWCFPRLMLEPILAQLQNRSVIPTIVPERRPVPRMGASASVADLPFRLNVSLGRLNPGHGKALLTEGTVIPLDSGPSGEAIISINGKPLLMGSIGESDGRFAVKITGPYTHDRPLRLGASTPFRKIDWPDAS